MNIHEMRRFWRDAFTLEDSANPQIFRRVTKFTLISVVIWELDRWPAAPKLGIEITPFEFAGAVLGLLLVLRTNAGYELWWEARKLWGGIVNQTRDLAIQGLSYGPVDPRWREDLVRWTIAFAHASRRSLRGERDLPEIEFLLGKEDADRIA